jgi:NAD(P)-dependent dehydrogenase (short-subunit alcohol dehydrogenase family)
MPNDSRHLEGKVALVTGAGSGIGRAAALKFAREGARVILAGRREPELAEVARGVKALGSDALVVGTDVTKAAEVERLVDRSVSKFGRLDVAFNNAGVLGPLKPIVELTDDEFDLVVGTNLRGVWLLARAEFRAMLSAGRGGCIINTSSFVAVASTAGTSAYAASKAGVDALTRALALEGGPHGIRANAVAPGVIRTPMSAGLSVEFETALANHAALRRLGEPADVADVVVWLATDAARFVTAQTLLVDGGFAVPGFR